jgi:GNAT superfamily N-acetyltransferase
MDDLYGSMAADEAAQRKASRAPVIDDVYTSMAADEATQRSAQLNASLRQAIPINPDQAAKVSRLSSATGVPPDVVRRNEQTVAEQVKLQQLQSVLSASPILARQMVDPQFASLAHDDADSLSNFENTANQSKASGLLSAARRGAANAYHEAAGLAGLITSAPTAVYGYATGNTKPSDWFASKFIAPHYDAMEQIAKEGKNDTFAQKMVSSLSGMGVMLGEIALTGGGRAAASQATTGLQVLGQAGMHAIKSMWMPATTAAVTTGKQVYEQTGDAGKALLAAEGHYVSTTGMGLVPLSAVSGNLMKGVGLVPMLVAAGERAATGAVAGGLGGEVARSINNATSPASMQTPFSWEDVFLSAATGGLMGVVLGPRAAQSGMGAAIHRAAENGNAAEVAQHQGATVGGLVDIAAADKVRERSPQNFAQFAQSVADEGPHPAVFVDAKLLATEAQAKAFDLSKMPETAKQMQDALAVRGDVRIPLGELTAALPGTGLDKSLLPHLRTAVDSPTMAEASDKSYADKTQQQVEQIMQQHDFDTARKASGDTVENELLSQMNTAGRFSPEVNSVNAKLAGSFFRTYSANLGITPEEMYVRYPLSIESQEGSARGKTLSQTDTPKADNKPKAQIETRVTNEPVNRSEADQQVLDMVHPPGENDRSIRAIVDGKEVGHLDLAVGPDNKAEVRDVRVDPAFRRQGIATQLHDEARARGFDLKRSDYETENGAAFGDSYFGKTLNQTDRGNISFENDLSKPSVIRLLKNADLTTFTHELGHFQLEVLADIAGRTDAPLRIREDMGAVLKWFGVENLEAWKALGTEGQRPYHEQLARGFEKYLFEGKAPSVELNSVFSRIRAWMLNAYKSLQSLNVELTPEVRGVFDRMLASNEQILDAEAQRGRAPLYDTAEAMGATAEEFKAYQDQQQEQTQEAVDQLEARSLRDMKWLSNAKSRIVKSLQREAKARRAEVETEVSAEVDAQPVYQAQKFLKTGEMVTPEGEKVKVEKGAKLDNAALKQMYPETMLARPDLTELRGMTRTDGLHPDLVADIFGFGSGDQLVRSILDAQPRDVMVEGMTDQRMLERYGDLNSPQAIEAAANEALSNEAHLKLLATELRFAERAAGKRSTLVAAAKAFATDIIARKKVSEIRPAMFEAAERKAQQEAQKAHLAGDRQGVAEAKRVQLVNAHAAKLAYKALDEIREGIKYQARFDKDSVRNKMDVDIRDQIDMLRERFDFRKNPPEGPTRAQTNLTEWLQAQIAAGYAPLVDPHMADPAVRMHYADMSVEQFRGYADTLKSMEHIGRERRSVSINGEKADLNAYVTTKLVPKIQERGERFSQDQLLDKATDRHSNPMALALDHFGSWFRHAKAQNKPQEFKRNEYDRHELLGPFGEALFEPVINASYRKSDMLKALSDSFAAKAKELGLDWQKSLNEKIANTVLIDPDKSTPGKPVLMNFTRGKMVGMALHSGNESNFNKLTRGWGWEPGKVWAFLQDNMLAKDWQAVQHVWDMYEKHWPEMEAMNRRLGNTSPDRIEPRPFDTPFGPMRGGYAAIGYDSLRSRRGEREAAGEAINPGGGLFGRNYFKADTTTNGSLNKRVDSYVDRVDLDFHTVAQRLNETVHDLAYREALIDANKIIEHSEFRSEFRKAYGREAYNSMRDWIGKLANANNSDAQTGALGKLLQYTRTGMVINAIAFRASTVLKHGGSAGFKSMGYFAGGGEKYFTSRVASMATDYSNQIAGAQEKFGEIRNRLLQQDRDFKSTSRSLFDPETVISKAERFGHAAVAWSDMMTAVPTAWGAYDRAITEGIPKSQGGTGMPMTEVQAVNYANKIVREAHGSTTEAARSMVLQSNSESIKMFTTLYGFMNTSYGQQLDGFDKLRTAGISSSPVLARTFMAIVIPALWAHTITHGGTKDDESWGAWIAKAILGEIAASVPFVRDAVSMVQGYKNAGMVPVESLMAQLVLAVKDISHQVQGDGKGGNAIKDVLNVVGTGLHIPGLGQLGSTLQYEADVRSGKENPKDGLEHIKGLVLGHGDKHK